MGMFDGSGGGLFGDSGAGLYGSMLDPQQRSALAYRGLLAAAGAFGQAAMPSRMPIPIGAALGSAAAAMGEAQDTAGMNALRAKLLGLQGQQLQYKMQGGQSLLQALQQKLSGGGPAQPAAAQPSAEAPPVDVNAGTANEAGDVSDPRGLVPYIRQKATSLGIDPEVAVRVAASEGLANPIGDGGKSGGSFQLFTGGGLGNEFQKTTGLDPLDPANEKATIDFALEHAAQNGWGPWNGAKRIGITGFRGIGNVPDFAGQIASGDGSPPAPSGGILGSYAGLPSPNVQMPQGLIAAAAQQAPQPGPGLPRLSPKYVFGSSTAPSNAGAIVPPAVRNYGSPAPGQNAGPIPPGYKPPSPLAGAIFGGGAPQLHGTGAPIPPSVMPAASGAPAQTSPMSLAPSSQGMGGLTPNDVVMFGAAGDLFGFPSLGGLMTSLPQYKGAQAAATANAQNQSKLTFAGPTAEATASGTARGRLPYAGALAGATANAQNQSKLDFAPKLAPYESAYAKAALAAQLFPAGSPQRAMAEAAMAKEAGIKPVLGGERPGVPIRQYNPQTGQYEITGQNPRLGEGGVLNQNGSVGLAPGAPEAAQAMATAHAAGPATFEPFTYYGPGGSQQNLPRSMLPGVGNALAAGQNPFPPSPLVGQPIPPAAPATPAVPPSAAPAAASNVRAEAAPPTFPVQTPQGPKDLSSLTVNDMFPGGQGVPRIPPGKPGVTMAEINKDDATRLEGYGKEAAENQKVYQDLAHLADSLNTGMQTGKLAPMLTDMTNVGHEIGWEPAGGFGSLDPSNAAVVDKAATDLIFQAVKKLGGQVKVAEIEGYRQANPTRTIPLEANYNILNDLLANGKWQDARANLANNFVVEHPGVPLNVFDTKFNQMVPLTAMTSSYKEWAMRNGFKFPGNQPPASESAPNQPRRGVFNPQTGKIEWQQ